MSTSKLAGAKERSTEARTGELLSLSDVEVVYGEISLALRGISLSVPHGGVVAVLGGNGAGKTTTIRSISGLLPLHKGRIRSGKIVLDGEDITGMRADHIVQRGVAQVPEGRQVFAHLTVEENLRVGASARRDRKARERLDQIFGLFPVLADRRNQSAGWMSGGEQQMIAIGRGLMAAPRLLLIDELSLGLAPQIIESIVDRLREVRRELGTAMLMVEQNATLALEFSEYGYVIENGEVVLEGTSSELRQNKDVQEFYLGMSESREKKNYAQAKHYKRRKRWV